MRIDRAGLRERRRWLKTVWGWSLADVVVRTTSGDVTALRAAVTAELGDREGLTLRPIHNGMYLYFARSGDRDRCLKLLSARLPSDDIEAAAPPHVDHSALATHDTVNPVAYLGYSVTRPYEAGPRNMWGVPERRWSVSPEATGRLADLAASWVTKHPGQGAFRSPLLTPINRHDLSDNLCRELLPEEDWTKASLGVGVCHGSITLPPSTSTARFLQFDAFGDTGWTDIDHSRPQLDVALDMIDLLRAAAPDIDLGFVKIGGPFNTQRDLGQAGSEWTSKRDSWRSRVYDAHAIQLLTSAHLELANDLSNWNVDKVSTDRWLVTARDLAAWFALPERHYEWIERPAPGATILDQARRDFGNMVYPLRDAVWPPPGYTGHSFPQG